MKTAANEGILMAADWRSMKRAVLLFIVSTMIMTGVSVQEGIEKEDEKTKKVYESSQEVPSASVEAIGKRFYAKYGKNFFEEETDLTKDNKKTEIQTETEQEPQTETKQEPQTETQTEQQTEPQTETKEQEEITTVQIETEPEVQPETMPEIVEQPENIACSGGIMLSDEDYQQLLKIVEAEAGNQDDVGKILVANVIFNRVRNSEFPNTVTEVIYQHGNGIYQFEPVLNGRIYEVTVADSTVSCVDRAIAGEDYSQGALYFTMKTSDASWFNTSLRLLFVHGDHYFYTC